MAEVKIDELQSIIGDREVSSPFDDILFTDIKDMGAKEHDAYVNMVKETVGDVEILVILALNDDEDHVTIHYVTAEPHKFERIRRITGYLTGDIDRWGNAKRAELRDRTMNA